MYKKRKKQSKTLAELHFVSSLQLEQSVVLLGNLANEQHQVTLTEVSIDEFEFEIAYLPNGHKSAEIKGNLRRWHGTETKINANGTVHRMTSYDNEMNTTNFSEFIIYTMLGAGITVASGELWIIAPVIFGAFFISHFRHRNDDNSETVVMFRERDYLFQILIDVFKEAGHVEAI